MSQEIAGKVILKRNEEKRIVAGHPLVYANEVQKIENAKNGALVSVYSFDGKYIGKGYINHLSKILVRIFIRGDEEPTKELFLSRIREAKKTREELGYSDSYRAIFAEADFLPGLIVDKYHDVLSMQVLSLGAELNKQTIIECLIEVFEPRAIVERSDSPVREKEGLKKFKGVVFGEYSDYAEIVENGLKMRVDVLNGQKTGYFLDQRDNRLAIRRYAVGKNVLDCFCNSGGFSLNAAAAGAKSVTAVDISPLALESVKTNAEINGLEIATVCGDVFEVLREMKKQGKTFDLIVLDPPAFAKSASDVKNALRGYKDVNSLAMKLLTEGGILVSSSCSHHVSFAQFSDMIAESAREAGKRARCLEIKTQGADHLSDLGGEESTYLKFFVLKINRL